MANTAIIYVDFETEPKMRFMGVRSYEGAFPVIGDILYLKRGDGPMYVRVDRRVWLNNTQAVLITNQVKLIPKMKDAVENVPGAKSANEE